MTGFWQHLAFVLTIAGIATSVGWVVVDVARARRGRRQHGG